MIGKSLSDSNGHNLIMQKRISIAMVRNGNRNHNRNGMGKDFSALISFLESVKQVC